MWLLGYLAIARASYQSVGSDPGQDRGECLLLMESAVVIMDLQWAIRIAYIKWPDFHASLIGNASLLAVFGDLSMGSHCLHFQPFSRFFGSAALCCPSTSVHLR